MSALPYMPLYVADYLADTAHLSALENGAYLLLIMNYWQRGNPLPSGDVQLARIARVSNEEWQTIRPSLAEFFFEDDGLWRHNRIDAELEKVRDKSAKASKAGKASAQRPSNRRSTDVQRTFNHTDTDTDTEDGESNAGAREPLADLETQCREAAGWQNEPAPMLTVTGQIQSLIDAGADLELDVLPTIRALAPKCRSPSTWKYFLRAIAQARDDRIAAATIVSPPTSTGAAHGKTPVKSARSNFFRELRARLDAADESGDPAGGGGDGIPDGGEAVERPGKRTISSGNDPVVIMADSRRTGVADASS